MNDKSPQVPLSAGLRFIKKRVKRDYPNIALKGDLIMQDVLKNLKWEITKRGARIIGCDEKFEGAMEIPSRLDGVPVVEIGEGAFSGRDSLSSVVIPDSVEVVGEEAFKYCAGLEELRLGEGIKTIEDVAFRDCSSLRRVVLPSTLKALARDAFDESVDLVADDDM